jgi:hypothetical protein
MGEQKMTNSGPTPSLSSLARNDQLFLGGSLLALICTFLPFDGISEDGFSATENAWHGIGFLSCLLVLIALGLAAWSAFGAASMPELPVSINLLTAGAMALAVVFYVIRWLTLPSYSGLGVHIGLSLQWGGYILLIVAIVTTVVGVLRLRASGESMPWENRGGAATPPAPPAA